MIAANFDHKTDCALTQLGRVPRGTCHENDPSNESTLRTSRGGSFALPAQAVRDLAKEPGTLFHRILTNPLGHILDVTEIGYAPSRKLKIAVQTRDGTCVFATCNRPAIESDLDHQIPHPRGPTTASNLRALCRRHHNMKTHHITKPTTHTMTAPTPSPAEHDLATFMVQMQYAA